MKFVSSLIICGLAALGSAGNLATTTRYFDGSEGACGCGTSSGNFGWQQGISTGVYTAAGSQALFDTNGGSWCGGGCGKCYNLTATGSSACSTCGTGETAGKSIIVMVTNLCPNNGNEQWCPTVGGTNQYGYSYHFDIMAQSEVFGDNALVEFEPVACPGQAATDWEQCVCFGQTAQDETPAGLAAAAAAAPMPSPSTSVNAGAAPAGGSGNTVPSDAADTKPAAKVPSNPSTLSTFSTVIGASASAPASSQNNNGTKPGACRAKH